MSQGRNAPKEQQQADTSPPSPTSTTATNPSTCALKAATERSSEATWGRVNRQPSQQAASPTDTTPSPTLSRPILLHTHCLALVRTLSPPPPPPPKTLSLSLSLSLSPSPHPQSILIHYRWAWAKISQVQERNGLAFCKWAPREKQRKDRLRRAGMPSPRQGLAGAILPVTLLSDMRITDMGFAYRSKRRGHW